MRDDEEERGSSAMPTRTPYTGSTAPRSSTVGPLTATGERDRVTDPLPPLSRPFSLSLLRMELSRLPTPTPAPAPVTSFLSPVIGKGTNASIRLVCKAGVSGRMTSSNSFNF